MSWRVKARRMIVAGLEAEVDQYIARFSDELDEDGHRLVVRNGRGKARRVTVGSGRFAIRAPRVNDRRVDEETDERMRPSWKILPRYARRSPRVTDALPILYLRGLSTRLLLEHVREGFARLDAGEIDAFELDDLTDRGRRASRGSFAARAGLAC